MKDAQWLPLHPNQNNRINNNQDKVYSEVTSGSWYKRTYDAMIEKHRQNHSAYPSLLVAIVLGQDGTLCDKFGQVSSEPILVSVANISYQTRKITMLGFVLNSSLSIQKHNWNLKRIVTEYAQKKFQMNFITLFNQQFLSLRMGDDGEVFAIACGF